VKQEQIQQIRQIIYNNYYFWTVKKTKQFKQFHYYKCREISQQELNLYALTGLSKAIRNYKPTKYENCSFNAYAKKYIIGELYIGMTELQALTIAPKNERKKNVFRRNVSMRHSSLVLMGDDEYHINENYATHLKPTKRDYEDLWIQINASACSPVIKEIFYLKFSFDFNKIRSNQQIANMLGYSEEYVRQQLRSGFNTFFVDF
jgi:DNA-directed RNA polymerase specialized sigma subunit